MVRKQVPREKVARVEKSHNRSGDSSASTQTNHAQGENARNNSRVPPHMRKKRSQTKSAMQLVLTILGAIFCSVIAFALTMIYLRPDPLYTPLSAPRMVEDNATLATIDPERFWGSYRPGAYFGMKTRSPYSPVIGLMWMNQFQKDPSSSEPVIRHWCSQSDGMTRYGWTSHDGVNFGSHETVDEFYTVTTEYVKRSGGLHGGDWSARVRVTPRVESMKASMSLFVYLALDAENDKQGHEHIMADISDTDPHRLAAIRGFSPHLGAFTLSFPKPSALHVSNHLVGYSPSLHMLHDALRASLKFQKLGGGKKDKEKEGVYMALGGTVLPNGVQADDANFMVSQVTFQVPFEMEMTFESGSVSGRTEQLSGTNFQSALTSFQSKFDKRFDDLFSLKTKGYDEEQIRFAKATLSNMLGGIGYFHGRSLVTSGHQSKKPQEYWPASLYTGVPSRSFFPRGFLWDEGFHNILIERWDRKISMDIIGHWFDLMNEEGWIPREQILGSEARARVPDEFVVQNSEFANPPMLFLPLRSIVSYIVNNPKDIEGHRYLKNLFPRLRTWYNWYQTTQAGTLNTSYHWRGRNATNVFELNPKTLTSGLDDYPRASHPTADERHVDLRCWMALAAGVMADVARTLNESSWQYYADTHAALSDNKRLDELHWSEKTQRYADFGLHTDGVKLLRPAAPKTPNPRKQNQQAPPRQKERVITGKPMLQFVDSGLGYVSLFPFLLKIVDPDSPKLGRILQDIRGPLWTPYGLRSLEKKAPLYGKYNSEHDPPYWRGAIWINMNYLAINALKHYSTIPGPHGAVASSVYAELRGNVVRNMYEQYSSTGYVWEQYDDETGRGKGSHPFTGWSALVVSIMAELY